MLGFRWAQGIEVRGFASVAVFRDVTGQSVMVGCDVRVEQCRRSSRVSTPSVGPQCGIADWSPSGTSPTTCDIPTAMLSRNPLMIPEISPGSYLPGRTISWARETGEGPPGEDRMRPDDPARPDRFEPAM